VLRTVLVPTDFSEECGLVYSFTRGLTALGVDRVVLAHVIDASGMEGPIIGAKTDEARDRLSAVADGLSSAGLAVEVRVPAGDVFFELLALAHERAVDAVVCGTHGKKVIQQMFQGSVSERLLQEGGVPMVLARYDLLRRSGDASQTAARFGERLLMPTDFSAPARRAFDMVTRLPKGAVTDLTMMHVVEPILSPDRREKAFAGAEFQLDNLREITEREGLEATTKVLAGDAKDSIVAVADEMGATGIIVGSRGRSQLGEVLLGGVSMRLLRKAPCPVMVVH
jgi:nucleotide-binding universal stress UspA family protein